MAKKLVPVKMWCIQGQRLTQNGSEQVSTFYLHPNVQGIMNREQAIRIAESVCGKGWYSAELVEVKP